MRTLRRPSTRTRTASRRRPLLILTTFLVATLLAGCGYPQDLEGEVTGKEFQQGYDYVYMQPIYTTTCSGNPPTCTSNLTGMYPIFYTVPDCYSITVEGITSGSTCITAEEYDTLNVGDHYIGPDVKPKDRQTKTGEGEPTETP